jgi:hypothetical protein
MVVAARIGVVVVVPIRARALIPVVVSSIIGMAARRALLLVASTAVAATVAMAVRTVRAARER